MTYLDLMRQYAFYLTGMVQPEYYLGGDMDIAKDENMVWSTKIYIKHVAEQLKSH